MPIICSTLQEIKKTLQEQFRTYFRPWTFPDFLERAHCLPHVAKDCTTQFLSALQQIQPRVECGALHSFMGVNLATPMRGC